ncbi:MAG: MBL fold metallo-hydrolase [Propionibacteriaceae bacterium]|nr:MBL fold metallo-hydrolase [Propionibacteriaceae bacterium]
MEFRQLRPHVFVASLDEGDVTVTVLVGQDRCLLADTGSSPALGAQIREAVSALTDKPLETVVVTHGHWDHAFGLAAFQDLDTIGHENLIGDLRCEENLAWAKGHGVDMAALARPATAMSLIAIRDLGRTSVEIAHFGPGHTRSDLIIASPQLSTIIVGDLVETGPPQFDETSSLSGWVKSLDALHVLLKEDTIVIPGHGPALDFYDVAHFRAGLAAIWDQSEWAYAQGIPVDAVFGSNDLEWPWDQHTAVTGIALAYQELAARPRPDTGLRGC